MGKIKCVKLECPQCHNMGLTQLFLRKDSTVRYARVRHYQKRDSTTKKPQFTYCKIEDLQALITLLKSQGISLSVGKADGALGQSQNGNMHDLELQDSSPIQKNSCGRRLVWFRTLAFQANDPGFESRRPHQTITLNLTAVR
jgi:hypothetical protein